MRYCVNRHTFRNFWIREKKQKSRYLENEIIFPQIKKSLIALLGLYYGEKYFFSGGNL